MLLHQSIRDRRSLDHWQRIALGVRQVRARQHERIARMFDRACKRARWPEGMSLWLENLEDGSANIYVSPAAVAAEPGLVHHFHAVSCARPSRGLRLLGGH